MSFLCCSAMTFKEPDVSLSLDPSATSILDGELVDQSGKALYRVETADAFTRIISVPSSRRRPTAANAAMSIRWPQRYSIQTKNGDQTLSAPDAMVSINGETTPSRRLLRRRKLLTDGKSHKFRIDGYKPTFRWKRKGRQYSLFVSGNKQPLAYLSCDYLTATFRLEVYGISISSYHGQDQSGFVSSVLLDHIVLTALLLVTPPLEWRRVCGATATRTTTRTTSSEDFEEPPTIVHHDRRQQHQYQPPTPRNHSNPFDDSYFAVGPAPVMTEMSSMTYVQQPRSSSMTYPSTEGDSVESDLMRRTNSRTSSSSSRTLVQGLVQHVLASISSDSSSFFDEEDRPSSYHPRSITSFSPPPPYAPARSSR